MREREEIEQDLNEIHEDRSKVVTLGEQKLLLLSQFLEPEALRLYREKERELDSEVDTLNDRISELSSRVKEDVLEMGETFKTPLMMAMYCKGRVSWDTKSLDGYAAAHPEILGFKKTGKPSVSIKGR
jgi:hypothetical protein